MVPGRTQPQHGRDRPILRLSPSNEVRCCALASEANQNQAVAPEAGQGIEPGELGPIRCRSSGHGSAEIAGALAGMVPTNEVWAHASAEWVGDRLEGVGIDQVSGVLQTR
jgi:hypothetical protein